MPTLRRPLALALGVLLSVALTLTGAPAASAAPPAPPVVLAPASGSTVSGTAASLSVRADDPDGGSVDVTFLGREADAGTPAPNDADPFTFVVIPDTQNYTSATLFPIIAQQAQWIVDQRDALDVAFVSQLGDLVGTWDNNTQWQRVSNGLKVLDDAGVPNSVVPGNHDFNNTTGAFTLYDQYFPTTRYSAASWNTATTRYGGYLGQNLFGPDPVDRRNMNNFALFSAGGRDFLVLSLEWEAPTYALDWGRKVLAAYPDRIAIFVTHSFLTVQGGRLTNPERPGGTSAARLWSDFVYQECSIGLVVAGHEHDGDLSEAMRVDANRCGDPVPQIMSDYQERVNGGDGWLRYYTFNPAANTMSARTYSPKLGQFETDADSQFTLPFDLTTTEPAPFEPLGTVTVAAGATANFSWTGLDVDTDYEWIAVADDGTSTTSSATATFQTAAAAGPLALDTFTRTVGNGWGLADSGQSWSVSPASAFSASGGMGRITIPVGNSRTATIPAVSVTDSTIVADLLLNPAGTNSGLYASVLARVVGGDSYRAKIRVYLNGTATLTLTRAIGGVETTLAATSLTGLTVTASQPLRVAFEVSGTSPTTVRAKVWPAADAEPSAWRLSVTDSTAALQRAGSPGLVLYLSGTATAASTVLVDRFAVQSLGGPIPNVPPVASFPAPGVSGRTITVSGTSSSDSDGTIASWAWNFGDGGTASGATSSHVYAADGSYVVTLTVTDDDGATASTTRTVAVAGPNSPPVAQFPAPAISGRTITVDGSTSSDPDGTIASWAWNFGDGSTATGANATRTYAADGSYVVTLTVTDDDGATGTTTRTVSVSAGPPAATLATDAFTRTVANGWGTADSGGPWTVVGTASRYAVSGGSAVMTLSAPGTSTDTVLGSVSSTAVDLRADVSWSRGGTQGTVYTSLIPRRVSSSTDYRLKITIGSNNRPQLQLVRRVNGVETTIASAPAGTLVVTPGTFYHVAVQAVGTGSTTFRAKLWAIGTAEPGWQVTVQDTTAVLQAPGSIGFTSYLSGSATAAISTRIDDLLVTSVAP